MNKLVHANVLSVIDQLELGKYGQHKRTFSPEKLAEIELAEQERMAKLHNEWQLDQAKANVTKAEAQARRERRLAKKVRRP